MAKFIDRDGWLYIWGKLKTMFASKVDKENGKGLSTNDYTTAEKTKLAGIDTGANAYTHPSYTAETSALYKVTVDVTGHVSAVASPTASDIPALPASKITSGMLDTARIPVATDSAVGGIKVGAGLSITDGVLNADVQSVPVMTGATANANGTAGLVPAPESGDRNCFLRGDGLWWETPDSDEKVKVTTMPSTSDTNYPLMAVYNTSPSSGHTYGAAIPTSAANRPTINGKTGVLAAVSFSGSGAGLTNIPLSAITGLSTTYALKSELPAGAFIYKGTVANLAALQAISSPSVGDVYNVGSDEGGMNYAWNGTNWDSLGEVMEVDALTNAEIDAIMTA